MLRKVQVHVFRRDGEKASTLFFLALQRTPEKGSIWQPVTGKVEEGEEFDDAARREVFEETGLKPAGMFAKVGEVRFEKNGTEVLEIIYACEVHETEVHTSDEHVAFEWLPDKQAQERLYYQSNRYGLSLVLDELKGK